MEREEVQSIVVASLALAVAFTIAFRDGALGILDTPVDVMLRVLVFSIITVSLSFILHELGHRQLARRFGAYAEFRKWNTGLALALFFSLFGFVFAAPGAVVIHSRADLWGKIANITRRRMGLISLIGPVINIILAFAFASLLLIAPELFLVASFGFTINAWLAFFNLLPIPPLDGSKVFLWDKRIWLGAIAVSGAMVFVGF
ncbi:MAG: site-2 protease family protein [Candidatus Aenigmarchaeota archaeon]|nr:site-2 protease family protein [Candidatus Aenigmarchaeota archaeon]